MNRHVRYEVLQNEDPDEVPPTPSPVREEPAIPATMVLVEEEETSAAPSAAAAATPAAPSAAAAASNTEAQSNAPEFKIPEPPSYNIATALPSYEEAERTKLEQEEQARREEEEIGHTDNGNGSVGGASRAPIDPLLGTDGMFLLTFMVSFVFNWIGLLASQCLSQSVAGRLGSMAGFGLSLVKWVAILKHNNWIHGVADSDSWLWWLLILLGFLIFFRGCTQYIRIKHQWSRLSQNVRNNIFYYF